MNKRKLLVVREYRKACKLKTVLPDWTVICISEKLCGVGFDLIVVAIPDMTELEDKLLKREILPRLNDDESIFIG